MKLQKLIDDKHFLVEIINVFDSGIDGVKGKTITFNCEGYPHSVPMQARTHRVATFDVQSSRYCGERIEKILSVTNVEDIFYLRPVGKYTNRQGDKAEFTAKQRSHCVDTIMTCVIEYKQLRKSGLPEEMVRDILPQGLRQNFVVTFTLDQFFHFCNLRAKADSQLEIQDLTNRMLMCAIQYFPKEVNEYIDNYFGKAILTP